MNRTCGVKTCPCRDGDVCNYVTYVTAMMPCGGKKVTEAMLMPITVHEKNLRQMSCVISCRKPVTLHHCKSGSMNDLGPEYPNPGRSQKQNPFLQIPLHAKYHIGDYGIDSGMGVETWEDAFGSQLDFLHETNGQLIYDIWEQAVLWRNKTA